MEIEFTLGENNEIICNKYIIVKRGRVPIMKRTGSEDMDFLCEALNVSSINTEGWESIEGKNLKDVQKFTQHYFDSMSTILNNRTKKDSMFRAFILHTAPSGETLPLPSKYNMLGNKLAYELNAPDADYFHALLQSAEELAEKAYTLYNDGKTDYAWAVMQTANDCIINMWNNTTVPQMIQAVINNDVVNA